jgi:hypothetical protein
MSLGPYGQLDPRCRQLQGENDELKAILRELLAIHEAQRRHPMSPPTPASSREARAWDNALRTYRRLGP